MNRSVKEFVQHCAVTLPTMEPVYEFGSRQMPGQEGYADVRGYFPDKIYVGADYIDGVGVDVVLDLQNIQLPSESVGTIICMEVLEHVERPFDAMKEIYRILKPGGLVIISSPMKLRIHGSPYDYWRFTPEGFKSLLSQFNQSFVGFCGDEEFPDTVVGIAVKEGQVPLDSFEKRYVVWQRKWTNQFPRVTRAVAQRLSPFIPLMFSNSSFELWRRHCSNPEFARYKNLMALFFPPVILDLLRRNKRG